MLIKIGFFNFSHRFLELERSNLKSLSKETSILYFFVMSDIFIYLKILGLVWFGGFYGISTFVGYLTPNPFLCK